MSREARVEAAGRDARTVADVLVLLLTGVAAGLLFNGLGLAGKPPRGLDWIARPQVLVKLEDVKKDGGGTPVPGAVPTPDVGKPAAPSGPAAAEPEPQTKPAAAPPSGSVPARPASPPAAPPKAEAPASDLPEIPELAQPIQVQLPIVKKFFDAKAALFVDAREPDEYAEGHIPGAINVTFDQSVTDPAGVEKIDTGGKPVIAYCGGGTCEVSMQVAWAFVQAGHKRVLVFLGGWPEWTSAGYPAAQGAPAAGAK